MAVRTATRSAHWLTTRPVIESKRLPELVPRSFVTLRAASLVPDGAFAEKDDILVTPGCGTSIPEGAAQESQEAPARQTGTALDAA